MVYKNIADKKAYDAKRWLLKRSKIEPNRTSKKVDIQLKNLISDDSRAEIERLKQENSELRKRIILKKFDTKNEDDFDNKIEKQQTIYEDEDEDEEEEEEEETIYKEEEPIYYDTEPDDYIDEENIIRIGVNYRLQSIFAFTNTIETREMEYELNKYMSQFNLAKDEHNFEVCKFLELWLYKKKYGFSYHNGKKMFFRIKRGLSYEDF